MRFTGPLAITLSASALALLPAPAAAEPAGRTTHQERVGLTSAGGLRVPTTGPGSPRAVRNLTTGVSRANRPRRRSLAFFAQITDPQLADEMSPARMEYLRPVSAFLALWRPQEALGPQTLDQAVRNVNRNRVSRIADARGRRASLQFALATGDLSDNQQRNEVRWGVRILDGGVVDPFSGKRIGPGNRCPGTPRPVVRRVNAAVAARAYTGVQDYSDYPGPPSAAAQSQLWDPDTAPPAGGRYAALPRYPGLLERAQRPFRAEGLTVPWYSVPGNHDAAVQGFFAGRSGAGVATGCRKVLPPPTFRPTDGGGNLWDSMRSRLASPAAAWVPPDPARRLVSRREFKRLHGDADRGHGFGMVARSQLRASRGTASYYSWSPKPGLRFIALDTVGEGGGPDGNLDHPQFRWLERQLRAAKRRNELVVTYGHHDLATLTNPRPDELSPCTAGALACDADPRRSTPLHLAGGLRALLLRHPNVIAYVTGHVHRNRITPVFRPGGRSGFWQVTTASTLSFPQQTRLLEIMENGDDTLSIFGTLLDTASPVGAPPSGTRGRGMDLTTLGSVSRLLAANVRGATATAAAPVRRNAVPAGNVELVLRDPRR